MKMIIFLQDRSWSR